MATVPKPDVYVALVDSANNILTSPYAMQGSLTNAAAAPVASSLFGAQTALANAADPAIVEGRLTLQSVDLAGNQRVRISQTTPGTTNLVEARNQARRNAGLHHRSAIQAVDKLSTPAAPSVADVATGGSLAQGTTYNVAIATETALGVTTASVTGSVTTAGSGGSVHAAQVTIAQITNATAYDIFLSTAAAPLWVARITETQRAAGCTVTAVGTISATSPGAGLVNVNVVGTGVASTAAPFGANTAYVTAGITPINAVGYGTAQVHWSLTTTDLRSAPTLAMLVFLQDQLSGLYYAVSTLAVSPLTTRVPLNGITGITSWGPTAMIVLVDTLTGQGATVDIWVDLA